MTDCSLTYLQTQFIGKLKPWHRDTGERKHHVTKTSSWDAVMSWTVSKWVYSSLLADCRSAWFWINDKMEMHFIKSSRRICMLMFHMWSIGFLDLKHIEIDTKFIAIGAPWADLGAKRVFVAAILIFWAGALGMPSGFPQSLKSTYSKPPLGKVSCFFPEVPTKFTYIRPTFE